MKANLTHSENFDILGFDTMNNEEMGLISGGEEVFIKYDPETGEVKIIVRPTRP